MKCWSTLRPLVAAFLLALSVPSPAQADPVWNRIKDSGKLVCGAIPSDPIGSWVDLKTSQWEGYEISLCRQIADDLSGAMGKKITPEFKETSWTTVVLDLQSQKIDIWPGMSATPEREKALSMVGPIYTLAFCGMPRVGFETAETWEALNRPEVRIATVSSTSVETAFKKLAPKATHVTLPGYAEVTLAVQSGRADIMGADVLRCLSVAKNAPNAFKSIVFPRPIESLGSSAGILKGADQFAAWLQKWTDEMKQAGAIKGIFLKVFEKAGLDATKVPTEVQF